MICMGVDSSGKTAAVALMQDEKVLYEEFINAGLTHSQTLLPMMARGELKNVLFAATGALMSPTSTQQGESIPGISHLVHLVSGS